MFANAEAWNTYFQQCYVTIDELSLVPATTSTVGGIKAIQASPLGASTLTTTGYVNLNDSVTGVSNQTWNRASLDNLKNDYVIMRNHYADVIAKLKAAGLILPT